MALQPLRGQLPHLLSTAHMAQGAKRFNIKQAARIGKRNRLALVALQKTHAQMRLQLLDLHADG